MRVIHERYDALAMTRTDLQGRARTRSRRVPQAIEKRTSPHSGSAGSSVTALNIGSQTDRPRTRDRGRFSVPGVWFLPKGVCARLLPLDKADRAAAKMRTKVMPVLGGHVRGSAEDAATCSWGHNPPHDGGATPPARLLPRSSRGGPPILTACGQARGRAVACYRAQLGLMALPELDRGG